MFNYAIPANDLVRIEYVYENYWNPAKASSILSSTETAFIYAPECCIDFGLHEPIRYGCSDPQLITVCNVNCQGTGYSSSGTIVGLAESDKSNSTTNYSSYNSTVHPVYIPQSRTGSLYGLAYNKTDNVFYAGAFYYNSGEIGSAGTGGIYCVDNSSNDGTHLSVNATHVSDMITIANAGTDPTGGVCTTDNPTYMQYAAKIGLGDVDINASDDTLYTINLNSRELVVIPVSGCTSGTPTTYSLPTPTGTHGCTGDEIRPHALKYHQGKLYVGAVCSANSSQLVSNLWAYVFEYTEGTGFNSVPVLDFSLNFERANSNFHNGLGEQAYGNWLPWRDDFSTVIPDSLVKHDDSQFMYPQPIFSDIEFHANDMNLSFSDRFSWQFLGGPDPSGTYANISSVPAGYLLKAGYNGDGTWTIENNGAVNGQQTGLTQTAGAGSRQGPGGGEFFMQESYSGHNETVVGGLAQIPGNPAVIAATFDPSLLMIEAVNPPHWGSGGLNWFDNKTGENDYAWEGYHGGGIFFSKGNGFGDVEYICDCPPIEVGNRIWSDSDGDGVQDPEEAAIANVVLNIFNAAGTLLGTTSTDSDGRFYFNDATVIGDMMPNTDYYIALDVSNFNVDGELEISGTYYGVLTDTDNSGIGETENNDSDAILPSATASGIAAIDNNKVPYISLTTGGFGSNNFTFDFGFYECSQNLCFSISLSR